MLIEHLSVSRTQCFDLCQQQYKYRYHLKVVPDKPEQIYFLYGKLVHKAAELYVENKGKTPINEIGKKLMLGQIPFEGSQNLDRLTNDYARKFYVHLSAVEKLTAKVGFDGLLEHKIEYDLDPPNNKKLLGFIDRLIIKNETALIIDYKTSKDNAWRKNTETIKSDLQLNAYAFVVNEQFGIKPENIHAALFYLEGSKMVSTNFKMENLQKCKELLKKTFLNIESIDENKALANIGNHCYRCDYSNICPYFRSKN